MDDNNVADDWQNLVDKFGLNKQGAKPWDALVLEKNYAGASHGEKCIIAFLLNVWDPGGNWSCGKFDAIDALAVWGEAERDAFLLWAIKPWWP